MGHAVTVDANGDVLVTGRTSNQDIGCQLLLLKYSSSGSLLWAQQYNGPGRDYIFRSEVGIALTSDATGNVFVAGMTDHDSDTFATLAFDPQGNLRWERVISDNHGLATDLPG